MSKLKKAIGAATPMAAQLSPFGAAPTRNSQQKDR